MVQFVIESNEFVNVSPGPREKNGIEKPKEQWMGQFISQCPMAL